MEIVAIGAVLFGIPVFTWPLYHSIVGSNRKERILRRLFIASLIGAALIYLQFAIDHSRDRNITLAFLSQGFAVAMTLATSCVLIFMRKERKDESSAS